MDSWCLFSLLVCVKSASLKVINKDDVQLEMLGVGVTKYENDMYVSMFLLENKKGGSVGFQREKKKGGS